MFVVSRFRVSETTDGAFREDLERTLTVLAQQRGHVSGRIGRNLDEPGLWTLVTEWENVGSYRRALSAYEVKLSAVPTLSRAVDEPSAYEDVEPGTALNVQDARSL